MEKKEVFESAMLCRDCGESIEGDCCIIVEKTYDLICPNCKNGVEPMIQCTNCENWLDQNDECFYPFMKKDEEDDDTGYEDNPFCDDCAKIPLDILLKKLNNDQEQT